MIGMEWGSMHWYKMPRLFTLQMYRYIIVLFDSCFFTFLKFFLLCCFAYEKGTQIKPIQHPALIPIQSQPQR